MALIQVSVIENVFTPEQKRRIVEKLTDAMVEVEGEAMRPVTWVTIQEVRGGEWGIGGRCLDAADVRAWRSRVRAASPSRSRPLPNPEQHRREAPGDASRLRQSSFHGNTT